MTIDQVALFHIFCQKALSTEYHHLRPNSHTAGVTIFHYPNKKTLLIL